MSFEQLDFSVIKSKEMVFKIVGKRPLENLALAIGENTPEGKEHLKDIFYDRCCLGMQMEFKGWCKIDIARLWDEFAIEALLYKTINKITISKAYFCLSEDSYYQSLIRGRASRFYDKYFSLIEFFVKNCQCAFPVCLRNFFKKWFQHRIIFGHKPIKITFTTQNDQLFKKIAHSVSRNKDKIIYAHQAHTRILAEKQQSDKEKKNDNSQPAR